MTSEAETMVERIARALCVDGGDDPDREGPFSEWFKESPYFASAKTVLTALLDPTEEMVEAGATAVAPGIMDPSYDDPAGMKDGCRQDAADSFRAMIQAALQPGSEAQ